MPDIALRVIRAGDPPPWPDIADGDAYLELPESWQLAVLEHGMTSGAPSVALRLNLPGGQVVVLQNSLATWIAATAAMRGAFPEAFAGGPLAASPG